MGQRVTVGVVVMVGVTGGCPGRASAEPAGVRLSRAAIMTASAVGRRVGWGPAGVGAAQPASRSSSKMR